MRKTVSNIDFEKSKKRIIKDVIHHLKYNLGERNTAILLHVLAESCDYTMGKKGINDIRQIEIKYNNFFSTKCDLKNGGAITHE